MMHYLQNIELCFNTLQYMRHFDAQIIKRKKAKKAKNSALQK